MDVQAGLSLCWSPIGFVISMIHFSHGMAQICIRYTIVLVLFFVCFFSYSIQVRVGPKN